MTPSNHSHLPLVTISMSTYNASSTLRATLQSLFHQTYPNMIIKLFDNCSSDDTVAIAQEFATSGGKRMEVVVNPVNLGGEGCWNKRCIPSMDGDYGAIFHQDDIYDADLIAKQVEIMENDPTIGGVFCHARLINENGIVLGDRFLPEEFSGSDVIQFDFMKLFTMTMKYGNFLTTPSALLRTNIYKEKIRFWNPEEFSTSCDLEIWFRLCSMANVAILTDKPRMSYRLFKKSGSYKLRQTRSHRGDFFRVYEYFLRFPEIVNALEPRDMDNYQFLQFKDLMLRSLNIIRNWKLEEKFPVVDISFQSIMTVAFSSRFHIRFFILSMGIYVVRTLAIPMFGIARQLLAKNNSLR